MGLIPVAREIPLISSLTMTCGQAGLLFLFSHNLDALTQLSGDFSIIFSPSEADYSIATIQ